MNFIKQVFSTVVGIFVFLFICIAILLLIGFALGSTSDKTVLVKPNSILNLKLDFPIKDYRGNFEFVNYEFLNHKNKDGLYNIINAINYAATDNNIKGISIVNNNINAGITQTKAIRDALLKFKTSGKFIVAYADIYSQKDYYLSSVADSIFINPAGSLEFKGLYTEQLYLKEIQNKTGIQMEVVRVGKYKSAVEPFLDDKMSPENREQVGSFLNSIWDALKVEISESRKVSADSLNSIADNLQARTPELAKNVGLVDHIGYIDDFENSIKKALKIEQSKDYNMVNIRDYAKDLDFETYNNNKIAVIYAEGEIIYGEGDEERVGQGSLNKALKDAREDSKVKAIVLRINSPGGSALASELIWHDIERTKKVKPVIVSMGDVAASGGYYIACNANKIIAEPSTITGSIGVFGVLPNVTQLAKNIGINAEQVATNKNTVNYSAFEPFSNTQHQFIQEEVIRIYDIFTKRVADGRALTKDAVEKIAQGRVWTGTQAIENGLVDALGGLDLAIETAANAAEISEYSIKELPIYKKDIEKILNEYGLIKSSADVIKETLGSDIYNTLNQLKKHTERSGIQILLPYQVDIK